MHTYEYQNILLAQKKELVETLWTGYYRKNWPNYVVAHVRHITSKKSVRLTLNWSKNTHHLSFPFDEDGTGKRMLYCDHSTWLRCEKIKTRCILLLYNYKHASFMCISRSNWQNLFFSIKTERKFVIRAQGSIILLSSLPHRKPVFEGQRWII